MMMVVKVMKVRGTSRRVTKVTREFHSIEEGFMSSLSHVGPGSHLFFLGFQLSC